MVQIIQHEFKYELRVCLVIIIKLLLRQKKFYWRIKIFVFEFILFLFIEFILKSVTIFLTANQNVLNFGTQVPESVLDKRSSAHNKGRVFIHGASEITANAYKKQFLTDLATFLSSRAVELKRGGSMFLVCLGRTSVDPTDQGGAGLLFGTHFQDAWDDLVQEVITIIFTIFFYACF